MTDNKTELSDMAKKAPRLRAIDLYSGIGGWALGLQLAGIDVVTSYEFWGVANETNFKNNHHQAQNIDIRRLDLADLPTNIDIVVGSPPCAQFSFSNRGGKGDIADGLRDIVKFLTIIDHVRPTAWAMENVPRVAKIIEEELQPGGRLHRFRHLKIVPHIINMEDFGLPQRRTRCIAGDFDFDLLASYADNVSRRTLGEVVAALRGDPVIDPIYGVQLPQGSLRDHVSEDHLTTEEIRINRASKTTHPVYNSMPFPDRLDRSVRTITATCTRVSRESIVIDDSDDEDLLRRLTIRERASLQSFPITFQFYGYTYGQKLRMVGNALPPLFAYHVAHAMRGTRAKNLPLLIKQASRLKLPTSLPADTTPERAGSHYPVDRKFRFAIPELRLKSGVRFELVNVFDQRRQSWEVNFYFGSSKSIHSISLDSAMQKRLYHRLPASIKTQVSEVQTEVAKYIAEADIPRMQWIWSHKGPGRTTPFMLLDKLDELAHRLKILLANSAPISKNLVLRAVEAQYGNARRKPVGVLKLTRNASLILAGLLLGSAANVALSRQVSILHQARRASTA